MICADRHCPRCHPEALVRMLQCEARTLLGWPLRTRQEFLAAAAKKRGKDAIHKLKAEMMRQWKENAEISFAAMAKESSCK